MFAGSFNISMYYVCMLTTIKQTNVSILQEPHEREMRRIFCNAKGSKWTFWSEKIYIKSGHFITSILSLPPSLYLKCQNHKIYFPRPLLCLTKQRPILMPQTKSYFHANEKTQILLCKVNLTYSLVSLSMLMLCNKSQMLFLLNDSTNISSFRSRGKLKQSWKL